MIEKRKEDIIRPLAATNFQLASYSSSMYIVMHAELMHLFTIVHAICTSR